MKTITIYENELIWSRVLPSTYSLEPNLNEGFASYPLECQVEAEDFNGEESLSKLIEKLYKRQAYKQIQEQWDANSKNELEQLAIFKTKLFGGEL